MEATLADQQKTIGKQQDEINRLRNFIDNANNSNDTDLLTMHKRMTSRGILSTGFLF